MKGPLPTTLDLPGLTPAPPQEYGAVRLIPLLRPTVRDDLRLTVRRYQQDVTAVALTGRAHAPGLSYLGYVPHGLVVAWSDDGSPVSAYGTQLGPPPEGEARAARRRGEPAVRLAHRMVQRESDHSLRLLPLHLAMEGFMALHFGGPDIAWREYAKKVLRHGLSPRVERVAPGRAIDQLDEALRVFELHEQQCGVVVLVADALASVSVVPHADDYRLLHKTLVEDFYGELILQYSRYHHAVPALDLAPPEPTVPLGSLAELAACLATAQSRWAHDSQLYTAGLLGRRITSSRVHQAGPFTLSRFLTGLADDHENHIGELITREDGTVEYCKTFRLSDRQVQKARLLDLLQRHHWDLGAAAASIGKHRGQLVYQLVGAGLDYLLSDAVLQAARRGAT
jgi:hypothetical protein